MSSSRIASPSRHVSRFGFVHPVSVNEKKSSGEKNAKISAPLKTRRNENALHQNTGQQKKSNVTREASAKNMHENAKILYPLEKNSKDPIKIPDEVVRKVMLKNSIRPTIPSTNVQNNEYDLESQIPLDVAYTRFPQHSTNERIVLNFKVIGPDLRHSSQKLIPRKLRESIKTLCLSQNNIESLQGISFFHHLESLSLAHNKIATLKEFMHIPERVRTTLLRHLVLRGNPITKHPDYKHEILRLFPNLETLDQEKISQEEKNVAITLASKLTYMYLKLLYLLEEHHTSLTRECLNLQLKLELYRRAYGTHQSFCRYDIPYDTEARIMKRYKEGRRLKITNDDATWEYHEQLLKSDTVGHPSGTKLIYEWTGIDLDEFQRKKEKKKLNTNSGVKVPILGFNASVELQNAIVDLFQFVNNMLHTKQIEIISQMWKEGGVITEEELKFGTRLILLVLHLYENQYPNAQDVEQIRSLRQELEIQANNNQTVHFQIFTSNTNFLKILLLLIMKKVNMVHGITQERLKILESNFFALSIPGLVGGPSRGSKTSYIKEQTHPWRDVNHGRTPMEESETRRLERVQGTVNAIRRIYDQLKARNEDTIHMEEEPTVKGDAVPPEDIQQPEAIKIRQSSNAHAEQTSLTTETSSKTKKSKAYKDENVQSVADRLRERASQIQNVILNHRLKLNQLNTSSPPPESKSQSTTHQTVDLEEEIEAEEINQDSIAFYGQVITPRAHADNSKRDQDARQATTISKEPIKSSTRNILSGQENLTRLSSDVELKHDSTVDKWNKLVLEARDRRLQQQLNDLAQAHHESQLIRRIFYSLRDVTRNQRLMRIIFLSWQVWAHQRQSYRKAVRKIRSARKSFRMRNAFDSWRRNTLKNRHYQRKRKLVKLFEQRVRSNLRSDRRQSPSSSFGLRSQSAPRRLQECCCKTTRHERNEASIHIKQRLEVEHKNAPWKPPSKSPTIPKLLSRASVSGTTACICSHKSNPCGGTQTHTSRAQSTEKKLKGNYKSRKV